MSLETPEWITEQFTYFTDWCNECLQERQMKVRDFEKDFSDGVMIINLLEVVTVGRFNKNPRFPSHKLDNISIAINFMERKWDKKLHGVTPNGIMEGDTRSIMGLLFVILWAVKRDTSATDADIGKGNAADTSTSPDTPNHGPNALSPTNDGFTTSMTTGVVREHSRRGSVGSIFHSMRSNSISRSRPAAGEGEDKKTIKLEISIKSPQTSTTQKRPDEVTQHQVLELAPVPKPEDKVGPITTDTAVAESTSENIEARDMSDAPKDLEERRELVAQHEVAPTVPMKSDGSETTPSPANFDAHEGSAKAYATDKHEEANTTREGEAKEETPEEPAIALDSPQPVTTEPPVPSQNALRTSGVLNTTPRKAKRDMRPDLIRNPRKELIRPTETKLEPSDSLSEPESGTETGTETETDTEVETDTEAESPRETPVITKTSSNEAMTNQGKRSSQIKPSYSPPHPQALPNAKLSNNVKSSEADLERLKKRNRESIKKEEASVEEAKQTPTAILTKSSSSKSRDTPIGRDSSRRSKRGTGTHSKGRRKSFLAVSEKKPGEEISLSDDEMSEIGSSGRARSASSSSTKAESNQKSALSQAFAGLSESPKRNSLPAPIANSKSSGRKRTESSSQQNRSLLMEQIKLGAGDKSPDSKKGKIEGGSIRSKGQQKPQEDDKIELQGRNYSHNNENNSGHSPRSMHKRSKRRTQDSASIRPLFLEKEEFITRLQAICRARVARRQFKLVREDALNIRYADTISAFSKNSENLLRLQAIFRGALWRKYPPRFVKDHRTRKAVIEEVVQTEEYYVSCLNFLNTKYHKLLTDISPDFIDASNLKTIFSSSQMIHGFNTRLLTELKKRVEKWFSSGCIISDVFLKLVDFMKIYTAYVNYYDEVSKVIEQALVYPQVAITLATGREDPDNPKQLDLMSMLIMPIQRLPRYVLLIKELLTYTPEGHPDYGQLEILLSKLSSVTSYINQKKKEMENYRAVSAISEKLTGYDQETFGDLIKPTRTFIRQGSLGLFDMDPTDASAIEAHLKSIDSLKNFNSRYVFLFTDMILSTKSELTDKSLFERRFGALAIQDTAYSLEELRSSDIHFRFATGLGLQAYQLIDVFTQNDLPLFALTRKEILPNESNFVVFAAPSRESKISWMRDINTTLWTMIDNRRRKLEFRMEDEMKISVKANSKATSGYLYLNYNGIPGTWIRRFVVVFGSKMFLSTHEQAYCENKVEQEIHTLNLQDILSWPIPNAINFMDFEDDETKENRKYCFMVKRPKPDSKSFTTIYFAAPDLVKMADWINAIRNSISAHLDEIDGRSRKTKGPGMKSRPKIVPLGLFSK